MSDLSLPFLELAILIPLLGGMAVGALRDATRARHWALVFFGLSFVCTMAAWQEFVLRPAAAPPGRLSPWLGDHFPVIDELSAPLLPMIALLYLVAMFTTKRVKLRRYSFSWTLVSGALTLATFACQEPWLLIGLLAAGTVPPYLELRARGRPTRVYALHMALFVALLVIGWLFVESEETAGMHSAWVLLPLMLAVLIRSGMVPVHCWMTDLFEHATFGTALLYVLPITGAYAAVRLVVPIAPDWVLRSLGIVSLVTAVYAAGLALVQRETRRFFCYLFLSHSALVLAGLEVVTPMGLTGALCVWLSVGLALGGFGLTLRALESRFDRLSLTSFHGLYEHIPTLAVCFAVMGLASVGFPGTLGFVGTELLVDGAVETYPHVGIALIVAGALNGIAVVRAYFYLFTGTRHAVSVPVRIGPRERFSVLLLVVLLIGGAALAQPWVASRHLAAEQILERRQHRIAHDTPPPRTRTVATRRAAP